MPTNPYADGDEEAVYRLRRLTFLQRQVGLLLALGTTANIGVLFLAFFPISAFSNYSVVGQIATTIALVNLMLAVFFESYRKRGESLFEEISDEFQWHLGRREFGESNYSQPRPPTDVRIILRDFTRAGDLPLVPGRLGPAIYVALNIAIPAVLLSLFMSNR